MIYVTMPCVSISGISFAAPKPRGSDTENHAQIDLDRCEMGKKLQACETRIASDE